MADAADIAGDNIDDELARRVAATRSDIPTGIVGICALCGEDSPRLIGGVCARCRDKYGLG